MRGTTQRVGSLEERLERAERKIEYLDGHARKMTSSLLFVGSIFGLLGFCFAFVTGYLKYLDEGDTKYFPSTVSEMVHDPMDPAGKAFFAFELTAAIFIFISYYPWELRNVYIGDDDVACCGVSWIMLRQFIPAPGMMLVATVTTTPINQATIRDWFTISIHLTGAMMMFVGYVLIEAKTLGWGMAPPKGAVHIGAQERKWRQFLVAGVCFWYAFFFLIQIILGIPGVPICCADEYDTSVPPQVTKGASGFFLALKIMSYLGEVLCGWSLIASHACIWYFCEERTIDLEDELTEAGSGYKKLNAP